ncbi:unnamed protein product, partial [Rotaria sp. Silwood1]
FTSSSIIANISGVNFRQIPSNESIQSQTIFEKLDNYIFNPINNNSLDINQVIQRYCQEKQWRQCHLIESLLMKYLITPNDILNSSIDIVYDDDNNHNNNNNKIEKIKDIRLEI